MTWSQDQTRQLDPHTAHHRWWWINVIEDFFCPHNLGIEESRAFMRKISFLDFVLSFFSETFFFFTDFTENRNDLVMIYHVKSFWCWEQKKENAPFFLKSFQHKVFFPPRWRSWYSAHPHGGNAAAALPVRILWRHSPGGTRTDPWLQHPLQCLRKCSLRQAVLTFNHL